MQGTRQGRNDTGLTTAGGNFVQGTGQGRNDTGLTTAGGNFVQGTGQGRNDTGLTYTPAAPRVHPSQIFCPPRQCVNV